MADTSNGKIRKKIGEGTFGKIYLDENGDASKMFGKDAFYIREAMTYKLLSPCKYIVKCIGCNTKEKTIKMKKYDTDIKKWILSRNFGSFTDEQKLKIIKGAFKGLIYIHSRGLIHGDVTPLNILINFDRYSSERKGKSVLCDLGFVARPVHAACESTAPGYREKNIAKDKYHDLFSLGIVLIMVFGKYERIKYPDRDYVMKFIDTVTNPKVKTVINRCVFNKRDNRPEIIQIFGYLYGYDHKYYIENEKLVFLMPEIPVLEPKQWLSNWCDKIFQKFNLTDKEIQLKINRIILDYLKRNQVGKEYKTICFCLMYCILPCLNIYSLTLDIVINNSHHNSEEICKFIDNIINDQTFVDQVFTL